MAAKKLRRAQLSQEMCERLNRYQITTCQVRVLLFVGGGYFVDRCGLVVLVFCWWIGGFFWVWVCFVCVIVLFWCMSISLIGSLIKQGTLLSIK